MNICVCIYIYIYFYIYIHTPAKYARQLIIGCTPFFVLFVCISCAYIPCTPGRVVTLQLDLANFTVVSQTMSRFVFIHIFTCIIE